MIFLWSSGSSQLMAKFPTDQSISPNVLKGSALPPITGSDQNLSELGSGKDEHGAFRNVTYLK